jgi:hypothetical protein
MQCALSCRLVDVAGGIVCERLRLAQVRFSSAILPAWCRRSPKTSDVLPLRNLHGL